MPETREDVLREAVDFLLLDIPPEQIVERMTPEQRLEGLPIQQRLEGITPRQRLVGLTPEELDELRRLLDNPKSTGSEG